MALPQVNITATGLFTPSDSITNEELVATFNQYVADFNQTHAAEITAGTVNALAESSAEFIEKASGIKSRYVMSKEGILDPKIMRPIFANRRNDEISIQAQMGVAAAKEALANAALNPEDIDLLIMASSNMQRAYPAISIEIQAALGIKGCAFDMNVACSSATFGFQQAYNAIVAGSAQRVLVVNAELCSAQLNYCERDCHFIFGDVATATVFERADLVKNPQQGFKVIGTHLCTDYSNNIRANFGFLNRCEEDSSFSADKLFIQEGRKVFKEVCPAVEKHIVKHLAQLNIEPLQVKRYWLHQANKNMNDLIVRRILGRDARTEEAPIILDRYANTASAGSIIVFHLHQENMQTGDIGVISSFGAGYSIGSIIVEKN